MNEDNNNFSKASHQNHPVTIGDINFTPRELDILACMVSGRRIKTIAGFLSIAPKTVETHIRNIMLKLECNSQESIINFIEKSGKFSVVKQHYLSILTTDLFTQSLKEVAQLISKEVSTYVTNYAEEGEQSKVFLHKFENDLKKVGITLTTRFRQPHEIVQTEDKEKKDKVLYIVSEKSLNQFATSNVGKTKKVDSNSSIKSIFLLVNNALEENAINTQSEINCIDFCDFKNYYFSFFELLIKLFPTLKLEPIFTSFKQQHDAIQNSHGTIRSGEQVGILPQSTTFLERLRKRNKGYLIVMSAGLAALAVLLFVLVGNQINKIPHTITEKSIRSDLPLPTEVNLLQRPQLLEEIKEKLKGDKGIQTVALVGIGGSGKTTLARQYAHFQTLPVVWEVNAETQESLRSSFENLAYVLSQTGEGKRFLKELQNIKSPEEREKKLIQLVKAYLRIQSSWLLIYDNVEQFNDIKKYFPSDSNTWGNGKVILTTRDGHVQNNNFVDSTIQIGELDHKDKLKLFCQIMDNGSVSLLSGSIKSRSNEQIIEFLNNIPPFPLDVSTAAYYLKATNISYGEYLNRLNRNDREFLDIQETVLKTSTEYSKTRYKIICLSLKDFINKQKDFIDLLLLVSLIGPKNIPRDLLERLRGPLVVDNFFYYLKKYSLIANSLLKSTSTQPYIFIHASIQDTSFSYLSGLLKLQKDNILLKKIVSILDDYMDQIIEQEDFRKMQIMVGHLEKLLNKRDILTNFSQGLLESKLGCIYYFLNNDKSLQIVNNSLKRFKFENLTSLPFEDNFRIARSYLHIGVVYTELRLYKEALESLESAAKIYGKNGLKNVRELSWTLSHLGNVYRRLGNYEKARDCLEESVRYNKQYGVDNKRIIRTLSCLGSVYRGLGFYQKAIEILEESLNHCKNYYPKDHFRVGRILRSLGNVYRRLGDYQQAKKYLENSLLICKKNFPENHINIGLGLAYLGNCLRQLGEYEKSRDCLEQSLKIHQIHYTENHPRMGWILFQVASTYIAMGKRQEAYKLFDKILKIYDKGCGEENIETARLLRNIAEIYLEIDYIIEAEKFAKQSLNILESRNHVDTYRSFEVLGDIYLKKSTLLFSDKNTQKRQNLQRQSTEHYNQALQIAKKHLPPNSAHLQRISTKIKNVKVENL